MTDKSKKPAASKGNVKGLSDYHEEEEQTDDDVRWYAGGEKSGIQLQAPKKNREEVIDDVMTNAQKVGARSISEQRALDNAAFTGGGNRLGTIHGGSGAVPGAAERERRLVISLWRNGFTAGDGPLRNYNSPENQEFLDDIKQGRVPDELASLGRELDIELIDKRGEDWKAPPPPPFSGSGQTLGRASTAAPTTTTTTTTSAPVTPYVLDESQPTTSIQIRLMDGSRIVAKFNHTHTIAHIRQYIDKNKPANKPYDLATAFPQQNLTDESKTIKDAGLINSVVVQKAR